MVVRVKVIITDCFTTGYVLQYTYGTLTTRSTWKTVNVTGAIPATSLDHLAPSATYHVKVAPMFGSHVGEFSYPPEEFETPPIAAGNEIICYMFYSYRSSWYVVDCPYKVLNL